MFLHLRPRHINPVMFERLRVCSLIESVRDLRDHWRVSYAKTLPEKKNQKITIKLNVLNTLRPCTLFHHM